MIGFLKSIMRVVLGVISLFKRLKMEKMALLGDTEAIYLQEALVMMVISI